MRLPRVALSLEDKHDTTQATLNHFQKSHNPTFCSPNIETAENYPDHLNDQLIKKCIAAKVMMVQTKTANHGTIAIAILVTLNRRLSCILWICVALAQ